MPATTSLPIKKRDNATLPELTFLVGSVFCCNFAAVMKEVSWRKYAPKGENVFSQSKIIKNEPKIMKKILFMTVIMTSMVLTSCNVTRTVTTRSETYQQGDTAVVIQSRTVESYDATKKINIY